MRHNGTHRHLNGCEGGPKVVTRRANRIPRTPKGSNKSHNYIHIKRTCANPPSTTAQPSPPSLFPIPFPLPTFPRPASWAGMASDASVELRHNSGRIPGDKLCAMASDVSFLWAVVANSYHMRPMRSKGDLHLLTFCVQASQALPTC